MYIVDQPSDLVGIGRRLDAVAEVEDVPRRRSGLREHPVGEVEELGGRRHERRRIEVSLDGDPGAEGSAGAGERQPPVDAGDVERQTGELVEECRPLVGKVDQRQAERIMLDTPEIRMFS